MKIFLLVTVLLLSGCAAISPSKESISRANYGSRISQENFELAVKATLKDPYSAYVSCTVPEKGYGNRFSGGLTFSSYIYGYISTCEINAKNGFGAYTGGQRKVFCVTNDAGFGEHGLVEMFGRWTLL